MASVAVGQMWGVAKRATLVEVRCDDDLLDQANALLLVAQDIYGKGRQSNSVVVWTTGSAGGGDLRQVSEEARRSFERLTMLHNMGVPVMCPAGNDRTKGRDVVDFWPSIWASEEIPLIVVGETDIDGERSENSQGGNLVTTYAFTDHVEMPGKDGELDQTWGNSLGRSSHCLEQETNKRRLMGTGTILPVSSQTQEIHAIISYCQCC